MKIVDSYESEIGILKYTKDELAPVSKHLRKKQKSEAEKAKKKNKFSLKNILAKLAGETKKKRKRRSLKRYLMIENILELKNKFSDFQKKQKKKKTELWTKLRDTKD